MNCHAIRAGAWAKLGLVVAPFAAAVCLPAAAQEAPGSIQAEFEDAFYSHDEIFFNNRSIARQAAFLLGTGFPDVEVVRDGQAIHEVYETVLLQQTTADPFLRTPDLPNPYQGSVLTTPLIEAQVFDNGVLSQPIPAPAAPLPGPIPALW